MTRKNQVVATTLFALAAAGITGAVTPGTADAASSDGPAQVARIFQPLLPKLHRTGVPALLPTLASLGRYHASILQAGPGQYDVFLGYVPNCQGDACEYGELIGKKLGKNAHRPAGTAVDLAGGKTGYYLNFQCGASCGESTVTVDVRGYRYIYGIKAGKRSEVLRLTNSALRAGPA